MAPDSTSKSVGLRVAISAVLVCILLGAGAGVFGLLLGLREAPEPSAARPPRTLVQVRPVERQAYREVLSGYGRARALRDSEVAAEVAAIVSWISPELEAGAHVAEGCELVRLDDRDFASAVSRAEAAVAQARAGAERQEVQLENLIRQLEVSREELELSQQEYERVRDDARTGAASQSELDAARSQAAARRRAVFVLEGQQGTTRADLHRIEAEIASAESTLDQARVNLARCVVRAPYSGRIVERTAQPGSRAAPGQKLFRIVDTSRVEVPVSLAASRFGQVARGADATIRLSESGPVVWAGRVARVSADVDPEQRTFRAYLEVEAQSENPVPPGAFVVATIQGFLSENVFVLPRSAFVRDEIYVAGPSDEGKDRAVVSARSVTVRRLLPDVALVESGLEPGERVVVTSVEEIADGATVRFLLEDLPDR